MSTCFIIRHNYNRKVLRMKKLASSGVTGAIDVKSRASVIPTEAEGSRAVFGTQGRANALGNMVDWSGLCARD
jgi:hypothetical protein